MRSVVGRRMAVPRVRMSMTAGYAGVACRWRHGDDQCRELRACGPRDGLDAEMERDPRWPVCPGARCRELAPRRAIPAPCARTCQAWERSNSGLQHGRLPQHVARSVACGTLAGRPLARQGRRRFASGCSYHAAASGSFYQQTKPPSTRRLTPVQNVDAWLARKTAGPIISSTVAIRPRGGVTPIGMATPL